MARSLIREGQVVDADFISPEELDVISGTIISKMVYADGTKTLTGDWDIGDGIKINADRISARDDDGLLLTSFSNSGLFISSTGNVSCTTSGSAEINKFSTDGTLTSNSDNEIPTVKAVKTYADNISVGSGTINVSYLYPLGFRNGLDVYSKYVDMLAFSPGIVHINDGDDNYYLQANSELLKPITGLSASTLYYVYIDPPESGSVISSSNIQFSSTAPSTQGNALGDYHPTNTDWRCVGEFYSKAMTPEEDYSTKHYNITNADVTVNTSIYKWGAGSLEFNGSSSTLTMENMTTDLDLFSGNITNWTIDFWTLLDTRSTFDPLICLYYNTDNRAYLCHYPSNGLAINVVVGGSTVISTGYGGEITDSNWHHLVFVKLGTVYAIYLDGAQVVYLDDASTYAFSEVANIPYFLIGKAYISSAWRYMNGNMDNLRFRHTNIFSVTPNAELSDSFSVPTSEPNRDASDILLLRGEPSTVVGATHFKRTNDRVILDDPVAIYTAQTLYVSHKEFSLPGNIPAGCTALNLECGTSSSATGNYQIVSPGIAPRNEATSHIFYNNANTGKGPTGSYNNYGFNMNHTGEQSIFARMNYYSAIANQNLHIWGYELHR